MTVSDEIDREEVSMLLPWYAAGTLDAAQAAQVEAAMAVDPTLEDELDLVLQDRSAALELAEETKLPASMQSRFGVALNRQIELEAQRYAQGSSLSAGPGLWSRIANWLAPPQRLALAGIAALVLIVAQSGVIVTLLQQPATQYQTATGEAGTTGVIVTVLVQFTATAQPAEITQLLAARGGRILDGPLPGGLYKIGFTVNDDQDRKSITAWANRQTSVFSLVLPSD